MILRALWLRPLRARPARPLATAAGVALGVASVVSTVLASRAAVASLGADVEVVAGRARVEVSSPGGLERDEVAALAPLGSHALLAPVVEGTALAPALDDLVRVLGVDLLLDRGVRDLPLEAGPDGLDAAYEALLHGRGCALSAELAAELGVGPGDALELVVQARRERLDVAAVHAPERFAAAWERVVLVDVATAQELFGRGGRVDRVELVPRGEVEAETLVALAEALAPPSAIVAPPSARRAEGEQLVRALDFNLTALSGVSVLVGMVLVATALATSIVQRRGEIALLRSLGASREQLARAILVEAAAVGLAGGAAGVALGWLGARGALTSVRATVSTVAGGVLPGAVRLEPRWIALGLLLGLVTASAAALLPLREALRTPPIQGLAAERPESVARRRWRARLVLGLLLGGVAVACTWIPPVGELPVGGLAAALLLLSTLLVLAPSLVDLVSGLHPRALGIGLPIRLAQAALEAGRGRAAWAAAAVGVAVGLAVSMTVMVGSFRRTVVDWTETTMSSDLFVRPLPSALGVVAGRIAPEVERLARERFGDEAVDAYRSGEARVEGRLVELAGADLAVAGRAGGVPFLDGRTSDEVFRAARAAGHVVVNEPFARRFDVGRGDRVTFDTPAGPVERTVEGVYRDYSGHTGRAVLDREDFLALYADEGPRSLAIFLPQGAEVDAARAAFARELAGRYVVELLDQREVRAEVLAVFDRTFAVTVALQLLASAVAALAVVTVLTALVHERRRELAVLRSLGGSRAQVAGVVAGEALLLGIAGALGGLVVGVAVGWILVSVVTLQSFGWTLRFLPPWGAVLATAGSVVPACVLAGLVPAFLVLRRPPQEALRELA